MVKESLHAVVPILALGQVFLFPSRVGLERRLCSAELAVLPSSSLHQIALIPGSALHANIGRIAKCL